MEKRIVIPIDVFERDYVSRISYDALKARAEDAEERVIELETALEDILAEIPENPSIPLVRIIKEYVLTALKEVRHV